MMAFVARAVGVRDGARVALPPSAALGWTTKRSLVSKFVGATFDLVAPVCSAESIHCLQSPARETTSRIPDFLHGVTAAAIVHYPDDDDGFRLLTLSLAEAYSTSKLNRKGQYDAVRRNCKSFATCASTAH
ncbi:g1069 [Coccomyxa elongata]